MENKGHTARLRGALVARRWTRSQPTDVVEVEAGELRFLPWLRPRYTLRRDEVATVEVERIRLPPFWWTTDLTFTLISGKPAPKRFVPLRPRRAIELLRDKGWPVRD